MDAIAPIIEQHAVDAAFLWSARRETLRSPATRVDDLARVDARIEANLDGLRCGGQSAEDAVFAELPHGDSGEVFAAAILAIESARPALLGRLCDQAPSADLWRGLAGAAAWLPLKTVAPAIRVLEPIQREAARRAALAAHTAHGRDPGRALHTALLDDDPALVAAALRAVGVLRATHLGPALGAAMLSAERGCRFWAAWSAVLLGDRAGAVVMRAMAEHDSRYAEAAAEVAAVAMNPHDALVWIATLGARADRRRRAVRAAAALGDPHFVPTLLDWLDDPAVARVAADAVSTITGISIGGDLAASAPELDEADAETHAEDEAPADPDAPLPWPNAPRVRDAWSRAARSFSAGGRWLLGRPVDGASLHRAMLEGRQRERQRAAFELARSGAPLVDVAGPCHRQRRLLAAGRA